MSLFSLPISPISSITSGAMSFANPVGDALSTPAAGASGAPSFAATLESAFGAVNDKMGHASNMAQAFATGKTSDVHSVMIASEQATIALQMTTQIRNKAVDAYQEIMRMSM